MTIICYRDGVMAADSASMCGGIRCRNIRKLVRTAGNGIAAATGMTSLLHHYLVWAERVADHEHRELLPDCVSKASPDEFVGLFAYGGDTVFRLQGGIWAPAQAAFIAEGCAWDFAMGAMAAGASAIEATRLTTEYCDGVHGPIQVERI